MPQIEVNGKIIETVFEWKWTTPPGTRRHEDKTLETTIPGKASATIWPSLGYKNKYGLTWKVSITTIGGDYNTKHKFGQSQFPCKDVDSLIFNTAESFIGWYLSQI